VKVLRSELRARGLDPTLRGRLLAVVNKVWRLYIRGAAVWIYLNLCVQLRSDFVFVYFSSD